MITTGMETRSPHQEEMQAMITTAGSRVAERPVRRHSPFHGRRQGGARCKGAFAAAVAAALIGYSSAGVAGFAAMEGDEPIRSERVALVIGNSGYVSIPSDPSGRTDAGGVGAALERLGFDVKVLEDAGYIDMLGGLLKFSQRAQSAQAAVVFYSGHGHTVGLRNYVIPVDTSVVAVNEAFKGGLPPLLSSHHVTEGHIGWIPVTWLLRSVEGASHLRLVVLDADVGASLGPTGGTTVALSAVVGSTVSSGGESAHSPYTEALLRYLEEPGLELGMLFRKVRHDVMRETGGRQEPAVYGLPGHRTSLDLPPDQPALSPPGTFTPEGAAGEVLGR